MSTAHALIIEDNANNMSVLALLLGEQGVSNTPVNHPRDLDSVLEAEGKIDVVFLDIEMPELNGYDVLEKLKLDKRFRNVPIVACTVHVSEINVAQQLGFHSFIGKPINSDKFPEQLSRILTGEPVWETV
jgi:CheY-like chemotaxis protein